MGRELQILRFRDNWTDPHVAATPATYVTSRHGLFLTAEVDITEHPTGASRLRNETGRKTHDGSSQGRNQGGKNMHLDITASVLCAALLTAAAAGDHIVSQWNGPDQGAWRVDEHWLPVGWPNNQDGNYYEVHITDGDDEVIIGADGCDGRGMPPLGIWIDTLEIDDDNQLTIMEGFILSVFAGSCVNNGTILLCPGPVDVAGLGFRNPPAVLSGDGVVLLSEPVEDGPLAGIWATYADRVTQASTHTIRGSGDIHVLFLTNEGLIEANQPTRLQLAFTGSPPDSYNSGTMQAIDGGTLEIVDDLDNTGGLIQALNGSTVRLETAAIVGGTLNTTGTGVIHGNVGARLISVTNTGTITAYLLELETSIVNDGVINVGHPDATPYARLDLESEEVTLEGAGEVMLTNDHPGNCILGSGAHSRLINGPNHTIHGSGDVGGYAGLNLTNQGSVIADTSGGLTITLTDDLTNEGLIRVTYEGSLLVDESPYSGTKLFTTSGTVIVEAERTMTRQDGDYVQTDGLTAIHGTLTVDDGIVDLQGGVLAGTGLVEGDVQNAATVAPGTSTGELTIDGDYTQTSEGMLEIELAGTEPGEFDVLTIDGDAELAGKIWINRMNGFLPQVGDQFTVLTTAGLVNEQFEEVVPCPWIYLLSYEDHAVVIHVVNHVCAEDLDCDGWIGTADLLLLLGNWGTDGYGADIAEPIDIVNSADLLGLLGMWGSCP